jgi:chlorobactene glucosyltransferase
MALWALAAAGAAWWLGAFWLTWKGRHMYVVLEPGADPPRERPPLTVFVPARDEERDVGDCLRSLLAQDYPGLRVVLADDGSTDRTRQIAEDLAAGDPRLEVMSPGDPPKGWVGKPHALYRAWRHAKPGPGTLLLFTDADIVFETGALEAAVAEMQRRDLDLLTLVPRLVNRGFWERSIQPTMANLIGLAAVVGTLLRPENQFRAGAGAFLLLRDEAYREVAGHRGVMNQIVEDVALITNIHHSGGKTLAMWAPEFLRVRMYRGLGEIWRGWAKNFFAGHRDRLAWAVLNGLGLLVGSVAPPILAVACALAGLWGPTAGFLLVSLAAVAYRMGANRVAGEPLWPALFHSMACVVVVCILVQSVWQRRFGAGAEWRGRRYPVS